jgi:hypothetical protein
MLLAPIPHRGKLLAEYGNLLAKSRQTRWGLAIIYCHWNRAYRKPISKTADIADV